MAVRVRVTHISRDAGGVVPSPTTNASLFVYLRGTTTQVSLYAADTGGSPLTQPINPDINGQYQAWTSDVGRFDLVETINGIVMPAIQWEAGASAIEAWINATMTNAWVDYGGYGTTGYCKTDEGLVKLRGVIKTGTVNSAAFTLPAFYRPATALAFGTISNNVIGRVDISAAGAVTPVTPSNNTYVTLDGIIFRAEQ